MSNIRNGKIVRGGYGTNKSSVRNATGITHVLPIDNTTTFNKRQSSDYWLATLGPLGSVSFTQAATCNC